MTTSGSTSAETPEGQTIQEAVRTVHAILDNAGVRLSPSKVSRIVRRWAHQGAGTLVDALAEQVAMSTAARRAITDHPDYEPVINYCDPTGEAAVRNVMRRAA